MNSIPFAINKFAVQYLAHRIKAPIMKLNTNMNVLIWVMLKDRYKQIQSDTTRYKQIRPDTSRYDQIRPDTKRYKQIQPDTYRYKQIHPDKTRYNLGLVVDAK